MDILLAAVAAGYIIIHPSFTHRVLSSEDDEMTPRRRSEVRRPGVQQPRTGSHTATALNEYRDSEAELLSFIQRTIGIFQDIWYTDHAANLAPLILRDELGISGPGILV